MSYRGDGDGARPPRSIWHNPALAETPRAIWHFSPDTYPLLDNKYRGHLLQCGLWDSNTDKIVVTSLRFPSLKFPQKFTGSSNSAYGHLTWILERRGLGEGKGLISEEGDGLIKWGAKVWKKREKARQKRKGMTAYHRGWRKIGPSPSLRTILALKWEMVFHLWDTLQEEYKNRFTVLYAVSLKKRSSARLSVPSIDNSGGGRQVCCWGPAQHISINSCFAARHAGLVHGRPTARRSNMLAYNTAVISNRKLKSITFGEKQVCCERCGYSNYNISQKCVHVHITVYVTHSLVVTGTWNAMSHDNVRQCLFYSLWLWRGAAKIILSLSASSLLLPLPSVPLRSRPLPLISRSRLGLGSAHSPPAVPGGA